MAFSFAYAVGFGAGRFLDRVGVKRGHAAAIVVERCGDVSRLRTDGR
jgi:hypothetical protein